MFRKVAWAIFPQKLLVPEISTTVRIFAVNAGSISLDISKLTAMNDHTNADLGLSFLLQVLQIANENEGWIVLKKDMNDNAFLSILFTSQFFFH